PVFGDGNTPVAIAVASVGIWLFHFLILRGVRQAAGINTVVTIAKVVPIVVFVIILAFSLRGGLFRENFRGGTGMPETSMLEQVRATMLVTVFVFLGIEGASVYSRYAAKRADVGRATIVGFVVVTTLMVLVTLLPFGALARAEIAGVRQPSMAGVLEAVVGRWGAVFVSVGLIVSVLGAYLAWSLICAEVLHAAARSGDMPRVFATENANGVPAAALWLTNLVVQAFVVTTYWSADAFALMLSLTSAMSLIPYLLVAAFGVRTARRGEAYRERAGERRRDLALAAIATVYTAFMIVAGGMKFVLLSAVLYAPGTLLYYLTRREQGRRVFTPVEGVIFALAVLGCVAGVYGLATGGITI
ncbi:MAG TPA: amino acid permease, partial [Longimicrobium sp.]|nr:amino acid permease [Longimicrobium sp.]